MESVGRYLLLLGEGGIENSLRGGSTRWLRPPCWQAHAVYGCEKYSGPLTPGKFRGMPFSTAVAIAVDPRLGIALEGYNGDCRGHPRSGIQEVKGQRVNNFALPYRHLDE